MLDFVRCSVERKSKNLIELKPAFDTRARNCKDLMVKGGDFYAVWDEDTKFWSTSEDIVIDKVDAYLTKKKAELQEQNPNDTIIVRYMFDSNSGAIDLWHKYVQKQRRDKFHQLDCTITFAGTETTREMYVSKKLPYSLADGPCPAYEELMSTLYDPSEREKLEWAVGAILCGDAQDIQKFIVIYGDPGSGKSTFLDIVELLFDGYKNNFKVKNLLNNKDGFALEEFKDNPLVSIDHEGKLDRVEDNTTLNSIVSHDIMPINVKYEKKYSGRFNTFIFIGTNTPVKITDAKSGLIRRLIDCYPSGRKVPHTKYRKLTKQVEFELGQIAKHCLDVYKAHGPYYYDKYIATGMIQITNEFYNFMEEKYEVFRTDDYTTLNQAWAMYCEYKEESNVRNPFSKMDFKAELKNYFETYEYRSVDKNGNKVYNLYSGFLWKKFDFEKHPEDHEVKPVEESWLKLTETVSLLDTLLADNPAQYVVADEFGASRAEKKWINNTKKLKDIDTRREHYVLLNNQYHIIIDFDGPDLEWNLKEASKWPPTYAEFSRSGYKIHLHYIYDGDPHELEPLYVEHIEQKVYLDEKFTPLRRKLTFCNDRPIAHISSGLKLKPEKEEVMFNGEGYKYNDEEHIRNSIKKALKKGYHKSTSENVNMIVKILNDAYNDASLSYDVSDLSNAIEDFASNSSNHPTENLRKVARLPYKSRDKEKEPVYNRDTVTVDFKEDTEAPIAFYDVEVFPNLFVLCYKELGPDQHVMKLINPSPAVIADLFASDKYRWIGFNSSGYDCFIIYKRYCGGNNRELYELSRAIISGSKDVKNFNARTIDYCDVFDFSSKKQSLKKFECELSSQGKCVAHQELGLDWNKPVPEELWGKVADYCANDVLATEAVFLDRQGDYKARLILVDIVNAIRGPGSHPRDSNNALTTRLLVGDKKNPQSEFIYPDLSKEFPGYEYSEKGIDKERYRSPDCIVNGHAIYKGYDPGYGGHNFAIPGAYAKVKCFDVDSMHPHSIIAECGFGPEITKIFKELVELRMAIKSGDYDTARKMFGGVVAKYLDDPSDAKALGQALKIVINSVYGLTAAKFPNLLRDPRNVDNWVAKRGALFMIDLHEALDAMGAKVVHIKTDSIKVVDPTPEIEEFIYEFAHEYGYNFKVEDYFERFCLINESTYVALDFDGEWHTTAKEFQVPYVKKTLFTHEDIQFEDLCEIKSVKSSMYLDLNEDQETLKRFVGGDPNVVAEELPDGNFIFHNYHFVGKTGRFIPVIPGYGGGGLFRLNEDTGKFESVTGTKKKKPMKGEEPFYRWVEAETVDIISDELEFVDYSYWDELCVGAIEKLEKFVSYKYFTTTPLGEYGEFLNVD